MGVRSDDNIGSGLSHLLCPADLIIGRCGCVLDSPVGADDNDIRYGLCKLNILEYLRVKFGKVDISGIGFQVVRKSRCPSDEVG